MAMSRTMQLAVRGATPYVQGRDTWFSAPVGAAPRTKVEQYWTARALVAETLLSARERHQDELGEMRRAEEQKREREIGMILQANDRRQRRLERWTVLCLAVLVGIMCWLVTLIAPERGTSHFTIPVLSPFASVVEHEMGVPIRVVAIFVLFMGVAVYAWLRTKVV